MNKNINIKVCGKWILAGEYSVLKSHPALAFPLISQFVELNYQEEDTPLQITVNTNSSTLFQPKKTDPSEKTHILSFFESVLERALSNISKDKYDLRGTITLHPHISFGAGMGTSAVICVLIGRLFHYLKCFREEDLFPFCHNLENSLHGQSSGVDIAAVLIGKPILFSSKALNEKELPWVPASAGMTNPVGITNPAEMKSTEIINIPGLTHLKGMTSPIGMTSDKRIEVFHPKWQAPVFLSHSGKSSSTKNNIKKIKKFWDKNPKKAEALNQQMTEAVLKAKEGLEMENEKKGLDLLIKSFSLAEECFSEWNLISQDMKEHISFLKTQGALAAKPTGSGAGGCVISLWPKSPPGSLSNQLISVF